MRPEVTVGEAANLVAYAFAPASLVTPLGALSVIMSAVLSAHFLGERLNVFCQMGCALALVGSTLLVLHAPQQHQLSRVDQVAASLLDAGTCSLYYCHDEYEYEYVKHRCRS